MRLDFSSSENKLDDLPLLILLMFRDGKTTVTLLAIDTIEEILAELEKQGLLDNGELSDNAKNFLDMQRREFELETQRLELKNAELVESIRNDCERQVAKITVLTKLLKFYLSSLEQIQKFIAETEESAELFVTKNKFRHQVKEDCRVKLKK